MRINYYQYFITIRTVVLNVSFIIYAELTSVILLAISVYRLTDERVHFYLSELNFQMNS